MASMLAFSARGPSESKTPGTGQCASSACAAHLDSFSDNVELIAAGLASCTGEDAGLAQYADVENMKRSIKGLADECGHTLGGSAQTAEDAGANVPIVATVGGAVGAVAALAVVIGVVVYLKKKAQAAKPPVAGVEVQSVKDEHI